MPENVWQSDETMNPKTDTISTNEVLDTTVPWWYLPSAGSGYGRFLAPPSSSASGERAHELVPGSENCTSCNGRKNSQRDTSINRDFVVFTETFGRMTNHPYVHPLTDCKMNVSWGT